MILNSTQIFGPPGCGKTERLMRLIEDTLADGVSPHDIVFVSFSKKAILEARDRARSRFNIDAKGLSRFRTLHSTGFAGLMLSYKDVMSGADYRELGRMLGEDLIMPPNPEHGIILPSDMRRGSRYLQIIDRARYRMIPVEQEWKDHDTHDMSLFKCVQVEQQLQEYKAKLERVDFVDMIALYAETVSPPPCELLIVDEAQDLTPLQWKMVEKMATTAGHVWIAGDDDQAIHRWTGVEVRQFIDISPNRVVLDQSYRLPKQVFDIGERIVRRIKQRVPKTYRPTDEEGHVRWHFDLDTVPLDTGSWTLMARTNGYAAELARQVHAMGYFYAIKGESPITPKQAMALRTWRELAAGASVDLQSVRDLYELVPKQGDKAVVRRNAVRLLDAADPEGMFNRAELEKDFGLLPMDDGRTDMDILNIGREMQLYLRHIEASGEDVCQPPRIKISTFHAMKGGEDDNCVVYLATTKTCEESRHQDDEHRAFYVGVTRARKELHIVESNKRYRYPL